MHEIIRNAVDIAQRAQRNYDLTKEMPKDDLETLIYAATNSPSKQNEDHFDLHVITDKKIIADIHSNTNKHPIHPLGNFESNAFVNQKGKTQVNQKICVTNSQTLANVLFLYVEKDPDSVRCGDTYYALKHKDRSSKDWERYITQKNYAIGISVGELLLSASILGYRTGCNSVFNDDPVKEILNIKNRVKLMVGVGYNNSAKDRKEHATVMNKDLSPDYRNGNLEEGWRFPSHNKTVCVYYNGQKHND